MSWCFCKIEPKDYVLQNSLAFAIFDIKPSAEGHMLVIPKRHAETVFDITEQEALALFDLIKKAKKFLDEKYRPKGYRMCVVGLDVAHAHIHLIPRYDDGKTN